MRAGFDQYVFLFHLVEQLESFVGRVIYPDMSVAPADSSQQNTERLGNREKQ
jgi:hypothetical protein